jgi:ketosteroid isomerase-like protein
MKAQGTLLATLVAASPVAAQDAPRVATTLPPAELAALEVLRKDIWVHWFTGDTAALRKELGSELIAISADSKLWQTLDETLAGSAQFKASGGSLVSVDFDNTTIHRFGDVVVMFSRYHLTTSREGREAHSTGRGTEVFVRANDQWVHTSWHLETTS